MRSLALLGLEDCPHLPPLGNRAGQRHTVVALITTPRAHAYCPTLLAYGAATWGATREEVLGHIGEMAEMIVERLAEEGASVPIAPTDPVSVWPPSQSVAPTAMLPARTIAGYGSIANSCWPSP